MLLVDIFPVFAWVPSFLWVCVRSAIFRVGFVSSFPLAACWAWVCPSGAFSPWPIWQWTGLPRSAVDARVPSLLLCQICMLRHWPCAIDRFGMFIDFRWLYWVVFCQGEDAGGSGSLSESGSLAELVETTVLAHYASPFHIKRKKYYQKYEKATKYFEAINEQW